MKISANAALSLWPSQQITQPQKTPQTSAAEEISQLANPAVNLSLSKEGLSYYHGHLSGGKQPKEMDELSGQWISMNEIPAGCNSLNFGIGLGGTLQEIGQRYAQKYDEIIQNHGKGRRVLIEDKETGQLRDATLEEKLAVLDQSFEYALDFSELCEQRRPTMIGILEKKAASYREMGAVDFADETEYRLERLKEAQKLPEDFRKHMIQIRENFKYTYHTTSKNEAWETMLKAINTLFEE